MLSMPMRSAAAQALRACGLGLPATPRVALVGRSFLIAPSYKSRVAARGLATATAKKTTSAAAKKPAAKKAVTKKPAAKKTATATKTATKGRKTAKSTKKAVAKPKKAAAKKEVDPEKQKVLLKRQLKKVALLNQEPKNLPSSAWLVYTSHAIKNNAEITGPATLGPKMKSLAVEFRTISSTEKQRLEQQALENKATNAANYKKWVESHSVVDIVAAGRARKRLVRDFQMAIKHPRIEDERMPKRPAVTGWSYYIKAKRGDNPGLSLGDMSRNLASQWRSLSATEKKPYLDLAATESARYLKEKEKALL